MKKTFLSLAILTVVSSSSWADEACYKVEGMTCSACALTVKVAIKKLDGIQDIAISVIDKRAKVGFDAKKTNKDAIKGAIDKVGYSATHQTCKKG